MHDVTTFVIAGGKSTRMGRDKAFLEIEGRMLIDMVLDLVKPLDTDIFIVGPKEHFSAYGRVVQDVFPDAGPLGGIHAALNRSRTEYSLVLPLDMPFLTVAYLQYLCEKAKTGRAVVTVTRTPDGLQPLCAIYRQAFKELAEQALEAGQYKIDAAFPEGKTEVVDVSGPEAASLGFEPGLFQNINEPADLERAAHRIREQGGWKD